MLAGRLSHAHINGRVKYKRHPGTRAIVSSMERQLANKELRIAIGLAFYRF